MSTEAMKQALEALIACRYLLEIEVNKAIERDAADAWIREKEAELRQHDAAITALRAAIASHSTAIAEAESRATEQAEKSNIKQVIHLYDEPPAAPVQEKNT